MTDIDAAELFAERLSKVGRKTFMQNAAEERAEVREAKKREQERAQHFEDLADRAEVLVKTGEIEARGLAEIFAEADAKEPFRGDAVEIAAYEAGKKADHAAN
jgi:hypothetical protein